MAFQRKKRSIVGTKAPYPGFIESIVAEQVDPPPGGHRWIHQIKFDGYAPSFNDQRGSQGLHPMRPRMTWRQTLSDHHSSNDLVTLNGWRFSLVVGFACALVAVLVH